MTTKGILDSDFFSKVSVLHLVRLPGLFQFSCRCIFVCIHKTQSIVNMVVIFSLESSHLEKFAGAVVLDCRVCYLLTCGHVKNFDGNTQGCPWLSGIRL